MAKTRWMKHIGSDGKEEKFYPITHIRAIVCGDDDNLSNLFNHTKNNENPHNVTAEQVGLGNVDNTSDEEKPVSIAQKDAIDTAYKQATAYTDEAANTLKTTISEDVANKLDKTGDASNVTNTITTATTRENLTTGEKLSISLGKISKWLTDLKTVALTGSYNDLSDKPTIPTVGNGIITITQGGAIKGTFTTNQSGNTTIALTDNNTDTKVTNTLATTTKAYVTGTTSASTNTGTQVFDTGVYLDTTAGKLTATTFNGSLTGNATTATTASNLSYFKCTSNTVIGLDDTTANGIGYTNGTSSILGISDGALYKQVYSSSWVHEIYGDYRTGQIAVRGKNNGTWQEWRTILDSGNYSSYTVTKTGSGASGTWGISIAGNAATATKLTTARTIQTNLGSTSSVSFNGTTNITPGVTGILSIANGGTGATTAAEARDNLGITEIINNLDFGIDENLQSKSTVFNADGSIVETYANGRIKKTVFDGNLVTETLLSDGKVIWKSVTTFNDDGSIDEDISLSE